MSIKDQAYIVPCEFPVLNQSPEKTPSLRLKVPVLNPDEIVSVNNYMRDFKPPYPPGSFRTP